MNILVLGWYHHRNAGDDAIQEAVTAWLEGHTLGFLPAGRPLPASFARHWDAIVIGGGGILQQRGGVLRDLRSLRRRTGVAIVFAGVSAERPTPELIAEIQRSAPHLAGFWARDQGTLDELGLHPSDHVFTGPDLTWLRPPVPDDRPTTRTGIAVAAAAHAQLDVDAWRAALATLPTRTRPWPFWLEHDADPKLLAKLLPNAVPADTHDPLLAHDAALVVSARYHGVVFALQQGRPVIGIGDAPKVRRLFTEHGLDRWLVPADRPDLLRSKVDEILGDLSGADAAVEAVARQLRAEAADAAGRTRTLLESAARPLEGRHPLRRWFRR